MSRYSRLGNLDLDDYRFEADEEQFLTLSTIDEKVDNVGLVVRGDCFAYISCLHSMQNVCRGTNST